MIKGEREVAENEPRMYVSGFNGSYIGNEDVITTSAPVFGVDIDPGFAYSQYSQDSIDLQSNTPFGLSMAEYNGRRDLRLYKFPSKAKDSDWYGWYPFSELVDNFEAKKHEIRQGQSLIFYGPNYLLAVKELGLPEFNADIVTKHGFRVSIVDYSEFERMYVEYAQAGLSALKDEISTTPLGTDSPKMNAGYEIISANTSVDEKETHILGIIYRMHSGELETSARYITVASAMLRTDPESLLSECLDYYQKLRFDNPLTKKERMEFEQFVEKLRTEVNEREKKEQSD